MNWNSITVKLIHVYFYTFYAPLSIVKFYFVFNDAANVKLFKNNLR